MTFITYNSFYCSNLNSYFLKFLVELCRLCLCLTRNITIEIIFHVLLNYCTSLLSFQCCILLLSDVIVSFSELQLMNKSNCQVHILCCSSHKLTNKITYRIKEIWICLQNVQYIMFSTNSLFNQVQLDLYINLDFGRTLNHVHRYTYIRHGVLVPLKSTSKLRWKAKPVDFSAACTEAFLNT